MTYYKYRWLIALALSGVLIALGFMYVIQPGLQRIAQLRSLKQSLTSRLTEMKSVTAASRDAAILPISQPDEIAMLARLTQEQGLLIQSMDYVRPHQLHATETDLIRLNLQGDLSALADFLFSLGQQAYMPIQNFTLKLVEQQHLRLMIEVYLLKNKWPLSPVQKQPMPASNLFCLSTQIMSADSSADTFAQASSATLDRIKMLGYLQQGSRRAALVLLPNNLVISVEQGSLLGREQGLVTLVSADHLIVTLPDKKQQEIRM